MCGTNIGRRRTRETNGHCLNDTVRASHVPIRSDMHVDARTTYKVMPKLSRHVSSIHNVIQSVPLAPCARNNSETTDKRDTAIVRRTLADNTWPLLTDCVDNRRTIVRDRTLTKQVRVWVRRPRLQRFKFSLLPVTQLRQVK